MGWDGLLVEVFGTYHYHNHSYEYLRVTSFKVVYSCVFCSVYCSSTAVILKSVLPNEIKNKINFIFLKIFKNFKSFFLFSCVVVFMYGI